MRAALSARTIMLLDGRILPTLLRLSAPNLTVLSIQTLAAVVETHIIGQLGTDALAAVGLAVPTLLLMQSMAIGGVGGSIAAALARALGGGQPLKAERLAFHGVIVALACGMACTILQRLLAVPLFRALGGQGAVLDMAMRFSDIAFAGSVLLWVFHALAAVLRGAGSMMTPGIITVFGSLVTLALSPALMLGLGPFPRLGLAGAAITFLIVHALGVLVLVSCLLSGRAPIRPSRTGGLSWCLFREILRVGLLGITGNALNHVNAMMMIGLAGTFGAGAIAGYGICARLEYLQIAISLGVGMPLVAMIGANTGAGQAARAKRIAWAGGGLAMGITSAIGLAVAFHPLWWLGLFSADPGVLVIGTRYLGYVGPAYGFLGFGFALYFSCQGAGRLHLALVVLLIRLVIGVGATAIALERLGFVSLHVATLASMVAFGCGMALVGCRKGLFER